MESGPKGRATRTIVRLSPSGLVGVYGRAKRTPTAELQFPHCRRYAEPDHRSFAAFADARTASDACSPCRYADSDKPFSVVRGRRRRVATHHPIVGTTSLIAKIADIKALLARGRADPESIFPQIRRLAGSEHWQTREVSATAMVEIGKRYPAVVLRHARLWAKAKDSNVRRAAIEGLRGIVKVDPELTRLLLEALRGDEELYVKKSVANVLRNASGKHAEFVLGICRAWANSRNPHTRWIVKDGLRKLVASRSPEAIALTAMLKEHASR